MKSVFRRRASRAIPIRLPAIVWLALPAFLLVPLRGGTPFADTMIRPDQIWEEYRAAFGGQAYRPDAIRSRITEREWSSFEHVPSLRPTPQRSFRNDRDFDEALLRRARTQLEHARRIAARLRGELGEIQRERINIKSDLWWHMLEAGDALDRREGALRRRYNLQLAGAFQRVFGTLDSIASYEMHREEGFRALHKYGLRMHAVYETALGNYPAAFRSLKRYSRYAGTGEEWPLHYYLSVCYRARFRLGLRDRGVSEYHLRYLRSRKNLHFLRAVELKFSRDSPQFQAVHERIRREELGSPRSSF